MHHQSIDGQLFMPPKAQQPRSSEEQRKSSDNLQKFAENQKIPPPLEDIGKTLQKSPLLPKKSLSPLSSIANSINRPPHNFPKVEFIYAIDGPRYRYCCCSAEVSALVLAFIVGIYCLIHLIGLIIVAATISALDLLITFFFVSPVFGLVGAVVMVIAFFTKIIWLFIVGAVVNGIYLLTSVCSFIIYLIVALNYEMHIVGKCPLLPKWFTIFIKPWYEASESDHLSVEDNWACKLFILFFCCGLMIIFLFNFVMALIFEFNIWRAYLQARDDKAILTVVSTGSSKGIKDAKDVGSNSMIEYAIPPANPNASNQKIVPANNNVKALRTVTDETTAGATTLAYRNA